MSGTLKNCELFHGEEPTGGATRRVLGIFKYQAGRGQEMFRPGGI